jgi:YD repeat-containing protein
VISELSTVYDAAGLPTSATDATTGESVTYTHDAVGNLTKIDSSIAANDWAHVYDAYSRLTCSKQSTSCNAGTTRVQLNLDALDRAVTRTYNGTTTAYTYQGASELVAISITGATTSLFSYTAGGSPHAQQVAGTTSFQLRDPR